jgi:hypothetical protein
MRIKLLDHVDITHLAKSRDATQKKGEQVRKTVLTTPTEIEVPLETTQERTVRKARSRG